LARDFFPLLFWGQVLVGFYSLFLTGISDFQYNQRYILFVVGFGLLALGIYFQRLKTELPCSVPIIKLFCVGASLLAMIHLASYGWPSYQIKMPVEDWMKDQQTSEYKYLRQSPWDLPSLSLAWEPLDYLTRSGEGWSVYMALGYSVFWVTPSYGSHIQNRIWNFEKIPTEDPDAFIFHYDRRGGDLFYVGQRITPEEVQRDGRYLLVTQTRYTMFWVKRELLDRPEVSKRLADYYRKTFGSAIQSAESLLPLLAGDGIVIMASPLGYGLKYLSLIGRLASPVYLVPENQEQATAERLASKKVYTIGKPLDGFQSHPIAEMAGPQEKLLFYENTRS
jgi:hypothetical protein